MAAHPHKKSPQQKTPTPGTGRRDPKRVRVVYVAIMLLTALAAVTIRFLMDIGLSHSSLLYVGIPFTLSLIIAACLPASDKDIWWHKYRHHTLAALAVFLGSSVLLGEGFICVLFFMPIYFFMITVGFLYDWYDRTRSKKKGRTLSFALPVIILATSLEGTTDDLSFNRDATVTVTRIVERAPADILDNMARPFDLRKDRDWLLSLFPMPYDIQAGSLSPGDVHRVKTRYHRWFFTNTHEGELQLQIVDVEPNRVTTRFIQDTTYFSSYVAVKGTEVRLKQISPSETHITLRINYERKLDPAWYFQPLQNFGINKMANFLIDEVMIREQ